MNSRPRTAVKTAALLLPAMLLLGGIKLGATELRRLGTKLTTTTNLADPYCGHTFFLPPNYKYKDAFQKWSQEFLLSLVNDQGEAFGFALKDLPALTITVHAEPDRLGEEGPRPPHAVLRNSWYHTATRRIVVDATRGTELADLKRELAHELVHAMMNAQARSPRCWPEWLLEGVAQYLETSDLGVVNVNARAVRALSPQLKPGILGSLVNAEKLDVKLAFDASYALVLYLLHGPHRTAFLAWHKEEAKAERPGGNGPEKLLATPKFEEEWLEWCRNPRVGP
jgi:hypothetical protein